MSGHAQAALSPGKYPLGTHCIGGWVGPRTGLDVERRNILPLPGRGRWALGRPARSQSLQRLRYPLMPAKHLWISTTIKRNIKLIKLAITWTETSADIFPIYLKSGKFKAHCTPTCGGIALGSYPLCPPVKSPVQVTQARDAARQPI
jgi:hypothetical protein